MSDSHPGAARVTDESATARTTVESDASPAAPRAPFLYVVVCASGIAGGVGELIGAARERGWEVGVVATPLALGFIDREAVEERTGYPVRSEWRLPGEPRPLPDPDAIAVAPATFNTVNKWAAGISDTLALGVLCEAYGTGVPIAVLPCLNAAQAAHPAYRQSIDRLSAMGVLIGGHGPDRPEEGCGGDRFRWEEALELLGTPGSTGPADSAPGTGKAPPPTVS
ncbi:flavoprotein [Streptomyces sp. NPDC095613]|uniref:flavoprotein n=1 Tax=Streptomyces sp. NPDC095613 TaxID=3155540 RepID=UPI0033246A57